MILQNIVIALTLVLLVVLIVRALATLTGITL